MAKYIYQNLEANTLRQASKSKLHDIVDAFEEDSIITVDFTLTETIKKSSPLPIATETEFYSKVNLEEFKNIKRIEVKL